MENKLPDKGRYTALTEGAMLAALAVVIGLMAFYLPVIGILAAFLWSLPFTVVVLRHGMRRGIMSLAVAGIILAMLIEPFLAARMVLSFGILGLILGLGYKRKWSGARIFCGGLITALLGEIISFCLLFLLMGINPLATTLETCTDTFNTVFGFYEEMGLFSQNMAAVKGDMERGLQILSKLFPLIVFLLALIDTVVAYWLSGRIIKKLGHEVPTMPPVREWRLNPAFMYLYAFALVGIYWGSTHQIDLLYQISLNAQVLATIAGMIQGVAVLSALMYRYNLSTLWRCLIYAFIFLNAILAQILVFIGLFDLLFDYRRRFKLTPKNKERH